MDPELTEDARVSFSVRELLGEQTTLLRSIDKKVDTKADKADLMALWSRIDNHDGRIKTIETAREAEGAVVTARVKTRNRLWGAGAVFVGAMATLVGSLIGAHVI